MNKIENYFIEHRGGSINFTEIECKLNENQLSDLIFHHQIKEINFSGLNYIGDDFSGIFKRNNSIEKVDFGDFINSKVYSLNEAFLNCGSLKEVIMKNNTFPNIGSMHSTFEGCTSLEKIDLSGLNTNSLRDISSIFAHIGAKELDLSYFTTPNITYASFAFAHCDNLEKLNIKNMQFTNCKKLDYLFVQDSKLKEIEISNFNPPYYANLRSMFSGCRSLINIPILGFKFSEHTTIDELFTYCKRYEEYEWTTTDRDIKKLIELVGNDFKGNSPEIIKKLCEGILQYSRDILLDVYIDRYFSGSIYQNFIKKIVK